MPVRWVLSYLYCTQQLCSDCPLLNTIRVFAVCQYGDTLATYKALRSAWTFARYDQSLCCLPEEWVLALTLKKDSGKPWIFVWYNHSICCISEETVGL